MPTFWEQFKKPFVTAGEKIKEVGKAVGQEVGSWFARAEAPTPEGYKPFKAEPLETMYTAALMYKQGMIGNYELYIDPYMEYSDTRLAVVHGNFYNFKEVEDTKLISEGTMAPRVVVSVKFKAKKPNSIVFNINDIKGIIK